MPLAFELIRTRESPGDDCVCWAPNWHYRSSGLPIRKGALDGGDVWLLVGWFASNEAPEDVISRFRKTNIENLFQADGQFILAVYSQSNSWVEICRDRFGILPLVYAEGHGTVAVSTGLDGVIRLVGPSRPKPANGLLGSYAIYRTAFAPHTCVEGVRSLSARSTLRVDDTRIHVIDHPMNVRGVPLYRSLREASVELGETLSRAVRRRLGKYDRIGAWLSGGNDSSLVVALARENYGGELRTVFVTFDDYDRNYGKHALKVARKYETEHTEIVVNYRDFLALWAETIQSVQGPLNSPSAVGQAVALSRLSGSVDALFTGEAADTVFGGAYWAPMLLLSRLGGVLPRSVRNQVRLLSRQVSDRTVPGKAVSKSLKAIGTEFYEYLYSEFAFGEQASVDGVFGAGTWHKGIDAMREYGGSNFGDWVLFLLLDYHPFHIVAARRIGLRYGVVDVFPFLDYELVRNALRLPFRLRYHYTTKKAALKAYAQHFFNRDFIYKPKEGFGVPLGKWFANPAFEPFLKLPLEQRGLRRGWWKEKELRRIIDLHMAGHGSDGSAESVPWIVVNLELWARICVEGDSPGLYAL